MTTQCPYFFLSDINDKVRIKIGSVKGHRLIDDVIRLAHFQPYSLSGEAEMYVTCQIYSNGLPLALPASTSYRCFSSARIRWDEWMTFPVKYRDLSPTSRIVFTVWSIQARHQSLSSLQSFTSLSSIASLSSNIVPPSLTLPDSLMDGATAIPEMIAIPLGGTCLPLFSKKGILKLGRRKLFLHNGVEGDGSIHSRTPAKTAGRPDGVEKLHKMIRKYDQKELPYVSWLDKLSLRRIDAMQKEASGDTSLDDETKLFLSVEFPAFKHPVVFHQKHCNPTLPEILPFKDRDRIIVLHDPEIRKENPIEAKFQKLARGAKGIADRDLKPKTAERKEIQSIIDSPNKNLTQAQKSLLWRFRYSLVDAKSALTKFLRCVDWNDPNERQQALDLLPQWAPIDTADALELLGRDFKDQKVREYAVKQLARADDEELNSYLLQLVQALRYETGKYPFYLSEFLINRATRTFALTNFFHWFLMVEKADKVIGSMFAQVHEDFREVLAKSPEGAEWDRILQNEGKLITQLIALGDHAKAKGGKVERKKERLKASLAADGEFKDLLHFSESIRIPVRPEIAVSGLTAESSMFTSALAPIRAHFNTPDNGKYVVIFKSGDDLRQDQLVIQLINLMDSLMKKVRLDLQLTPYRVLATAPNNGFVEFVRDSHTLTEVLDDHGRDIGVFLEKHNPKPAAKKKALDTFVRSTAGYCVITYLLGVGDRHMENLMLTKDGHLFHIDFGWLFGRDPKPFPPPIKFCKEMVLAMGGADSTNYHEFRRCVVAAFQELRQHASLILNLLSLMADAGIPHLSGDVEATIGKVQEKFRLDLHGDEADRFILGLIDTSMNAMFPKVTDIVHKWAMYWK